MFKYPWGNLQGLNLAWFLEKFNQLLDDWATAEAGIDGALDDEIQKAEDALSDVFDARDAAAASATAAAGSATQAGTSATAAQNSATAAASSATLANNKATAAGLSEANAAQSASQAALSATNAGNSATAAGNSATAAGNSATAAGNSATAAGNSASAAAISETNAAASAARAEEVEESIPPDYTTLANQVASLETKVTNIGINYFDKKTSNNTCVMYIKGNSGFTTRNFKKAKFIFELDATHNLNTLGCGFLVSTVNANNVAQNTLLFYSIAGSVPIPTQKFTFIIETEIQKNYVSAIFSVYSDGVLVKTITKSVEEADARAGLYALGIYSNVSNDYNDYAWTISGQVYDMPENVTPAN